ncbi:hypothetical protein GJ629_02150 [Halapricum sp. CBA1109]|uniref:hypothetical protein n=1 Tax=Halapricum sp. CBA1109 TaxID=2668068 RepID=UPI0013BD05C4|nr:hypothetical protein [Halapricum sp. CBA1109]MUV88841.1 hypothetical protein [Halapricum sp. CBA1109]
MINSLLNVSLGTVTASQRISDTQSGFRAYSTAAVDSLAADESIGTGMDASTDILYHAFDRDYEIREVGTTVYHDVEDSNSYHPVRHGLSLVHSILTTVERRHPILALGVPGAASILAGVGVAFWALERYLAWGTLPVGLSLLSVLLFLVGTFSCFTAIVLHALQNQKST